MRLKPVIVPFLLCFFLISSFSSVFAQNTGSGFARQLTLDEAVNLALEYNLSLRKTEIDLAASGYSEKNLWSEIFPTISASASVGYTSPLLSGSGFEINERGRRYSTSFSISLGLNAGIPYAMRSIRLAHQGNILRYEDARNQLSIQVTKMFFARVAEKNNLLLLEEILNLAQRQYTRTQTLFRNGIVGELSLLQSRLAAEDARFNLSSARIAHQNNMAEFLSMIGMSFDENITLSGEVNIVRIEVDAETLIGEYLSLRPDIVSSRQEIERLQNAHTHTVMQSRAPSLNLSMNWNSASTGTFFDPFSDTLSATATVNIPIDPWIPGTPRSQTISRASDSIEKARLDIEAAENSARTQIRSLSAMLRNSWDSIQIAKLSLDAAQRSYQLTEHGFLSGTVEALTLEDARNNMANARQRLLQTELSYFNMTLDLSAAINVDWKNFIQIFGVQSE